MKTEKPRRLDRGGRRPTAKNHSLDTVQVKPVSHIRNVPVVVQKCLVGLRPLIHKRVRISPLCGAGVVLKKGERPALPRGTRTENLVIGWGIVRQSEPHLGGVVLGHYYPGVNPLRPMRLQVFD